MDEGIGVFMGVVVAIGEASARFEKVPLPGIDDVVIEDVGKNGVSAVC